MPVEEVVQNPAHQRVEDSVADGEVAGEEKRGQDHHHRRAVDLLLARPRHPLHLDPNVEEVIAGPFPEAFLYRQLFSHSRFPPSVPVSALTWRPRSASAASAAAATLAAPAADHLILAGAAGFEPARPVLETGSLPLNLRPSKNPGESQRRDESASPARRPALVTSFPCAPCGAGKPCRTSSAPAGPGASACCGWSSSCDSCNRCTAW